MNSNGNRVGVWGPRFAWMMMLNAVIFLLITALIAIPSALSEFGVTLMNPDLSRMFSYGSAGNWFVLGYTFYFLIGVLAMGLFAVGYYILEGYLKVPIKGAYKTIAWINYILMGAGVMLSTWILMYAGYYGVSNLIAKTPTDQLHPVMAQFGTVIGISILVMVIAILMGLILFAVQFKRNKVWIFEKAEVEEPRGVPA
jgi:hypothetical protein